MTLKLSRHTNTYNVQTEITNSLKVQKAWVNKSLIVNGTIGAHAILKIIAGKLAPRTNLWYTSDERKDDAVPSPGSPKRSVANTMTAAAPPAYHLTKWCASEDWRAENLQLSRAAAPPACHLTKWCVSKDWRAENSRLSRGSSPTWFPLFIQPIWIASHPTACSSGLSLFLCLYSSHSAALCFYSSTWPWGSSQLSWQPDSTAVGVSSKSPLCLDFYLLFPTETV